MEVVVNDIANDVTKPIMGESERLPNIQILLKWDTQAKSLREIQSNQIGKLVKIGGIVISSTGIKHKV